MNTQVEFCGMKFKNPVMNASGTFGSGMEYSSLTDLNALGAIVTKGVAPIPWEGNPTPRIAETPSGMMNAIGLQNPGVEVFRKRDLKFLEDYDTNVIVNVCGHSIEEYVAVTDILSEEKRVDAFEINVSCPNVKSGGIAFGTVPLELEKVTKEVKKHSKKPVIMKLSPNVTSISEMAKAAEAAGADAISLINTFTAMKIDIYKRKFAIANRTGGLSGPAIRPIAVRMVYEAAHSVKIPVIGMGGIASGEDAIEFLMAGAKAVAVGMYNFHNPNAMTDVIAGIEKYMEKTGTEDINEIIALDL
ncbi:dihydroorotate dehydrogenase [Lachnospiraceae bacterium C1.1]|nr:dihydroorotate dehydrogenase [Lachnospiraceae bacterium C1.1]